MRRADYPQALERAAAPALAALERGRRRAPSRLRPLFEAIAEVLFEPELDLDQIARAAGIDGVEARRLFSELGDELGRSAWSYVRDLRLEVAARLLLETPISLLEIGRMVGYGSPSSFRQIMGEFLPASASRYRRQAPRILERGGPPPAGSDTEEYWERMLAGELSDNEARALDAYLERLAPDSTPRPSPAGEEAARWTRLRETLADGFVATLEELPFADRRRFVRDAVWFPDGTFFQRLSRQSREAGAEEPERGVEWALLAADSLAADQTFELESDPGLALLAWARLALARWRAGDRSGAGKDVERLVREAERAVGAGIPVAWTAEATRVVAALHWRQGRRQRALEIAEASVAAHRMVGPGELRPALELRAELRAAGADLDAAGSVSGAGGEGRPGRGATAETRARLEAALADVEEVCDLLDGSPEGKAGAVVGLWSRILVLIGDRAEMAAALPQVRRLAGGGELEAATLLWLEGHARTAPEALWRQARERFTALGDDLWVARSCLDLARFYHSEGATGEASARASEVANRLGALVTAPEDVAALKALGRAATPAGKLTRANLDRVDCVLKRFEWRRRSRRALQLAGP